MKFLLFFTLLLLFFISRANTKSFNYEYNDLIFGSYLRIKITVQDSIEAHNGIKKVMQILWHIDSVASVFNPNSEVSQLNKAGFGKMSPDLKAIIIKSLDVSEKSNGAFDITIGSAMKSWGFYNENQKLEGVIGYKKIRIKDDSIFLKTGMLIDLGGITVGYAIDKAVDVLKSEAVKSGLIDAGGDIVCFGEKTYKIGVRNPTGKDMIRTILIKNQAISTSGNYEKFIEKDNKKYAHIINPKTGQPISDSVNSFSSVTIIADKCVNADAYATAVLVLGLKSGQKLIHRLGYQGILITNDGKMIEVK